MGNNVTIKVENVSKKYCKNLKDSMIYGMNDIGRNLLGLGSHPEKLRKGEFWAVNNVSFEVKKGETLGIIGPNGSGKTTLLKMLNGIFWPDKGKITIKGRVGALIAVGAGFHPQLSGRENIYINGAILGMTKREIDQQFDSIVDFASIGDFLDSPVKHYSSGMYVRLGFAIAIHSDSEILLIDEVLSVGDMEFQAKCMKRMKEIERKGTTMIFISHNLNSVQLLCDKALYLNKGDVVCAGDTVDVLNSFKKQVFSNKDLNFQEIRFGTREVEITKVEFLDKDNVSKETFKRGQSFKVVISYKAKKKIANPEFLIAFDTDQGIEITRASTRDHGINFDVDQGYGEIMYTINTLPYNVGKYAITVGCYDETGHVAYDNHKRMYEIYIEDGLIDGKIRERIGLVHIPAEWKVSHIQN